MGNLFIQIAGYTGTVVVYVNNQLIKKPSIIIDAKYKCAIPLGISSVRIIKNSEIISSDWKKKVGLNWLLMLLGEYTVKDAILDANISMITFVEGT